MFHRLVKEGYLKWRKWGEKKVEGENDIVMRKRWEEEQAGEKERKVRLRTR